MTKGPSTSTQDNKMAPPPDIVSLPAEQDANVCTGRAIRLADPQLLSRLELLYHILLKYRFFLSLYFSCFNRLNPCVMSSCRTHINIQSSCGALITLFRLLRLFYSWYKDGFVVKCNFRS